MRRASLTFLGGRGGEREGGNSSCVFLSSMESAGAGERAKEREERKRRRLSLLNFHERARERAREQEQERVFSALESGLVLLFLGSFFEECGRG